MKQDFYKERFEDGKRDYTLLISLGILFVVLIVGFVGIFVFEPISTLIEKFTIQ